MDDYLGFIEFFVVAMFVMAWGVLELVGKRLDKKKEAERAKQEMPPRHPRAFSSEVETGSREVNASGHESGARADSIEKGLQSAPCYRSARGIRNGSIACTIGIVKRSSDRLSCIIITGSSSSLAEMTDRA